MSSDPSPSPSTVTVALGARSYPIHIGPGLLSRLGKRAEPLVRGKRVLLLTDSTVASLHLDVAKASLAPLCTLATHVVSAGESAKDWTTLADVIDAMAAHRMERGSLLVALGGGVVGDLGGFAASIYQRGMAFIQVPTTLLAQVDSAVGGKTAINIPQGKNLVGSFHQPSLVLSDLDVLGTLPRRELLAGYAEMVKYGVIDDPGFFDWLEAHGAGILTGDQAGLAHAVATSCRAKARIVAADEREAGQRALLNLGHTFGHALEATTGFGATLLHGEAVALGMVLAMDLSVDLGLCPSADRNRLVQHLRNVGMMATLADAGLAGLDTDRLMDAMAGDKKVEDGKLTLILARGIGQAFVAKAMDPAAVRATWARHLRGEAA